MSLLGGEGKPLRGLGEIAVRFDADVVQAGQKPRFRVPRRGGTGQPRERRREILFPALRLQELCQGDRRRLVAGFGRMGEKTARLRRIGQESLPPPVHLAQRIFGLGHTLLGEGCKQDEGLRPVARLPRGKAFCERVCANLARKPRKESQNEDETGNAATGAKDPRQRPCARKCLAKR
jgi:hypothetical protein